MTRILLTLLLSGCCYFVPAQQSRYFFHKLTVGDGLDNGDIQAIVQDRAGFLWFASISGLNRYDGYSVKTYGYSVGDSNSIPASIVRSMAVDSNGRFFAGFESGMMEYDAASDRFTTIPSLAGTWVNDIIPVGKQTVFLATYKGLAKFNPLTRDAFFYSEKDSSFKGRVYNMARRNNSLYLGCGRGLFIFDIATETLTQVKLPLPDAAPVLSVTADDSGNIWVITRGQSKLLRIGSKGECEVYDQYLSKGDNTILNPAGLLTDRNGRIWVITQLDGLLQYNPVTNKFAQFLHDPLKAWTPSTNLHKSIFCDRDGVIWVGGNNGLNYFNPDKNLFTIIPVFGKDMDVRNRRVARVATEDKEGNLWFGTIDGVVRFDVKRNTYSEWNNRAGKPPALHFNSVRGILCDAENNIWIATGNGINRYNQSSGRMDFFAGEDSIPRAFYFSADNDRNGHIWFGCRDYDGFYYYDTKEKQFHSIRRRTGLGQFAGLGGRKLLHDSKGRYWLGFNGAGLGMYDPASGKTMHWKAVRGSSHSIAGNIVVDIVEDKKGVIWVSTYNGLSGIDPETGSILNFNHANGLMSNTATALFADALDRLWIGTSRGLMMLDKQRTEFTSFGLRQGLPSVEFPEHAAYPTRNGRCIMPTQNGYIYFDPLRFEKNNGPLDSYLTGIRLPGREKPIAPDTIGRLVCLEADENFFTIGFAAINYQNPAGTWFAYKLEGIDEDWQYTQNRFASYTNIPGGDYAFSFKASADRLKWSAEPQRIRISIATVFYKTAWFRLLVLILAVVLVYAIYRYRLRQREKIHFLQGKAQLLEKEKAMVMYESLKQQLNPHFLFNSLTSLSGLIESDQRMAADFLDKMSKTYRYVLKNRESELVSLKEEIGFVQTYIHLQKTRFRDGLEVTISTGSEYEHRKIAPVSVQNLMENAIKHNVIDKETPLAINVFTAGDYLVVSNNLQEKHVVETSNKQGLHNLLSLYKYLTNKPVVIEKGPEHFTVKIPLL